MNNLININQQDLQKKLNDLKVKLKLEEKRAKIKELEQLSSNPDFWKDQFKAAKLMKQLAELQEDITTFEDLTTKLNQTLLPDQLTKVSQEIDKLSTKVYLSGKYDNFDVILSIHAGQGGTEACDWTQMLMRMYVKYCQNKGWQTGVLDQHAGEEAGLKSVIMEINGAYAYGLLKNEKGTHRLVRQSPFNADHLRQTSFALVEIMPMLEEDSEIKIKPEDLEFESTRSSGHGGQNINKVSTAVRIKHISTGIIVECQSQRYQDQNRKIAMEILRGKLWQRQEQEREKQLQQIKGEHKIAGWGNQIRSYVLHPYKLVKDERTNYEDNQAEAVLDGNLEGFIQAGLKSL